jgi:peroxiredoxin
MFTAWTAWAGPVPRPAGEFVFQFEDGRRQMPLTELRGKVVVVEFLFTSCPHCKKSVQAIQKVYAELGHRGFQPVGVAINGVPSATIDEFIRELHLSFPIGAAQAADARDFLQLGDARFMLPQLVVIDRNGTIRMHAGGGDPFFENEEENLRVLVKGLLKEKATGAVSAKPAARPSAKEPAFP